MLYSKSTTTHNETLIDNTSKDVEYVTPTSLKGISDFMIHQVFSTERIVPIESDDEDSKLEATEVVEVPTSTENKMSSFNSDDTLNNNNDAESSEKEKEKEKEKEEEDQTNPHRSKTISKSFADEFINLLNINMKEVSIIYFIIHILIYIIIVTIVIIASTIIYYYIKKNMFFFFFFFFFFFL